MRNTKKVLAAAMAGVMVLAQGSAAFAATSGGFNANVETEKAVLRVSVPTSMDIMVDQFEIGAEGVQINSDAFEMTNYSQMAVKVAVTSTVTLENGVTLVNTKNDAVNSEGDEAWLAVAAATEDGTFGDGIDKIDDTSANVDTFSNSKTVSQTFYLSKGTGDVSYKLMIPATSGQATPDTYVSEYYELTEAVSITDQTSLDAAIAAGDVYTAATTAADGDAVTLIKKGASATYDSSTVKYYTMVAKATDVGDLDTSKLYAYGATATAGAAAEFKYLGRLSDAKESWTNDDIKGISVAYTITGVTTTIYSKVADSLVYGYLASGDEGGSTPNVTVPTILTTSANYATVSPSDVVINYSLGSGSSKATAVSHIYLTNSVATTPYELLNTEYSSYVTVTDSTITISKDWMAGYSVGSTTNVFICFDMTDPTTERADWTTPDVTISVSQNPIDVSAAAPSVTTTSASFSKQNPSDVVINYSLGSGTSKATAITHLYLVNGSNNTEIIGSSYSNYVTITDSTITISKDWLSGYNENSTTSVYVCFDMTNPTTERTDWTTAETVISINK